MPPTLGHGKICYLQIPTRDIQTSADFYQRVFGWSVRRRGDGSTAFDNGVGEVSGEWVRNRQPAEPGVLVHIMVDSVAQTLELVLANGGQVVNPIGVDPGEITAHFRDPMGNVFGLYQEPA
ncbi:MAG TPA: VOC family protein [Candidatus Sulfotelmatobacter sp.]